MEAQIAQMRGNLAVDTHSTTRTVNSTSVGAPIGLRLAERGRTNSGIDDRLACLSPGTSTQSSTSNLAMVPKVDLEQPFVFLSYSSR